MLFFFFFFFFFPVLDSSGDEKTVEVDTPDVESAGPRFPGEDDVVEEEEEEDEVDVVWEDEDEESSDETECFRREGLADVAEVVGSLG